MAKGNEEPSPPSLKRRLFLKHSAVKVHKRRRVGNSTTLAKTNSQSGRSNLLKMRHLCIQSQWLLNQCLTIRDNPLEILL